MNRSIYILVVLLPLAVCLSGCEKKPSKKAGSICGAVTSKYNGEPVVGATVKLYRDGGGEDETDTYHRYITGATTSIVGRYEFNDLPCEYKKYSRIKRYEYSIEVEKIVASNGSTLSGRARVTVEPGTQSKVDIVVY